MRAVASPIKRVAFTHSRKERLLNTPGRKSEITRKADFFNVKVSELETSRGT